MNKVQMFPIGNSMQVRQQHINPYPTFEKMLTDEPVSWISEIGMWYVTRRADVLRILSNTDIYTVVSDKSLTRRAMGYNMLTTDGAEQARLRRPFNSSFAPRGIRHRAESFIEQLAQQLIDGFAGRDLVDIKAEYTDLIAIQTVVDMLGLEVDDYAQIRQWVSDFGQIMSNFVGDQAIIARGRQSFQEFADYVGARLTILRQKPDDTVLGKMVSRPEHHLSDDELIDSARVIIFGGVETTSALIVNTIYWLLRHPEQLSAVRAHPDELVPRAIEESLRFESPVQTCTRHVLCDDTVAGIRIKVGDTVQCMIGAANRDPLYFDNPTQFDIFRENARDHLAFANGKHFCIGAGLARMEADVSLKVLLARLPNMSPAYPQVDMPVGYEFRSPHQFRLRLT